MRDPLAHQCHGFLNSERGSIELKSEDPVERLVDIFADALKGWCSSAGHDNIEPVEPLDVVAKRVSRSPATVLSARTAVAVG